MNQDMYQRIRPARSQEASVIIKYMCQFLNFNLWSNYMDHILDMLQLYSAFLYILLIFCFRRLMPSFICSTRIRRVFISSMIGIRVVSTSLNKSVISSSINLHFWHSRLYMNFLMMDPIFIYSYKLFFWKPKSNYTW